MFRVSISRRLPPRRTRQIQSQVGTTVTQHRKSLAVCRRCERNIKFNCWSVGGGIPNLGRKGSCALQGGPGRSPAVVQGVFPLLARLSAHCKPHAAHKIKQKKDIVSKKSTPPVCLSALEVPVFFFGQKGYHPHLKIDQNHLQERKIHIVDNQNLRNSTPTSIRM